jgi:hypothetical protein
MKLFLGKTIFKSMNELNYIEIYGVFFYKPGQALGSVLRFRNPLADGGMISVSAAP